MLMEFFIDFYSCRIKMFHQSFFYKLVHADPYKFKKGVVKKFS